MINVGVLQAVLTLKNQMGPGLAAAMQQLQQFNVFSQLTSNQLSHLGRGMRAAGFLATTAFTVPIIAAGGAVVEFGVKWETEMTKVITLAGATRTEINNLEKEVLDLAVSAGVMPEQLAKGLYVIESFGQTGRIAMESLRVSADMAALGMGSVETAAHAVTGAMFAYRNQQLDAARAGDILLETVKVGNAEINELVPALATVNPIAAAMKIRFEEVAGAIATYTHAGVNAAVASTGIRAMLNNILMDSAKTEKGFQRLSNALGDNTINMKNFMTELREKGLGQAMVDLTNKIRAAGEEGTRAFGEIFPNIRGLVAAIDTYAENGGMLLDLTEKIMDSQGSLAKSTAELHQTFAWQWDQMRAEVAKFWIELSKAGLLDLMKSGLGWLRDTGVPILKSVIQWFGSLSDSTKIFILTLIGLTAASGPVLIFLGQLIFAFGEMKNAITALLSIAGIGGKLGGLLGLIAAPEVLAVAAAIGAVTYAIYKFHDSLNNLKNAPKPGEILKGLKDAAGNQLYTLQSATQANNEMGKAGVPQFGLGLSIDAAQSGLKGRAVNDTTLTLLERIAKLTEAEKARILHLKEMGYSIAQVTKETGIAADVVGAFERQTNNNNRTLKAATKQADEYAEAWTLIADRIANSVPAHLAIEKPLENEIRYYHSLGITVGEMVAAKVASKGVIEQVIRGIEAEVKATKEEQDAFKKSTKEFDTMMNERIETAERGRIALEKAGNDYNELLGERMSSTLDQSIEAIQGWAREQMNAFKGSAEQAVEYKKIIDAIANEKTNNLYVDWTAIRSNSTAELQTIANKAWATYQAMLADSGNYTVGTIQHFKEIAEEAQNAANGVEKSFKQAFREAATSFGDILISAFTGGGGIVGAIKALGAKLAESFIAPLKAVFSSQVFTGPTQDGKMPGATLTGKGKLLAGGYGALSGIGIGLSSENMKQGLGAVSGLGLSAGMSAAQAGASVGASIAAGAITAGVAAAVVGGILLAKKLHKSESEKLGEDIARDMGVKISAELAKSMEKDSKKYGRQATQILHLDEIIEAAGGLEKFGVGKATKYLHDLFSMLETGKLTTAQAAEVMNKNFAAMAEKSTDKLGFLSAKMKEIIDLDRKMGVRSEEVTKYLIQQAEVAVSSSNDIIKGALEPQMKAWDDIYQRMEDANKAWDEAKKQGDTSKMKKADAEWTKAWLEQRDAAIAAEQELNDLGVIAIATFGAAMAAGKSFSEALAMAAPGLQQLAQAFKDLGMSPDDPLLKVLMVEAEMLKNNPALIQGIGALGNAFAALSNMGLLNQETFESMERQGMRMYTRLQAAAAATGGGTREALLPMQDFLHKAAKAAEELGIPLDENLQMLIDQSKELGIWKEAGKSATDKLVDGMGKVVDKLTGVLDKIQEMIDRLNGIPRNVDVDVNVHHNEDGTDYTDPNSPRSPNYDPTDTQTSQGFLDAPFAAPLSSGTTQIAVGSINPVIHVTENVDRATLNRNLTEVLREGGDAYDAISVVAKRSVGVS